MRTPDISSPEESKRLRVVYIVNARIPNERAHGIQIVRTCEALSREDIDLTLVTSTFPGQHASLAEQYGITESFVHRRLFAIDIPHLPFRYVVRNASFFVSAIVYLLLGFVTGLFSGRRVAVYVRGELMLFLIPLTYLMPIFFETHQIRNYAAWYRMALRHVRGIIVVTQNLKQKFIDEYRLPAANILVARDAVDLTMFANGVRDRMVWEKQGISESKTIVLYAGTLAAEKGVDTLALASRFVPDTVHIVFLGGTDAQVQAFRAKYGTYANVSILGRVEHTEVPRYIASADMLILPDRADFTYSNLFTSPMKLFEYMASGLPIIASRVPSLLEVLTEETALFFESGNAEELGKRMSEIAKDPDAFRTYGERARAAVEAFTWEKRAGAIVAHIKACMKVSKI